MSTRPLTLAEQDPGLLVDPHARLSLTLVLSLVLWSPFGLAALGGQLDLVDAGLRYLVAFFGCRLAVGGISHLLESYHRQLDPEAPAPARAPEPTGEPELVDRHRRATD